MKELLHYLNDDADWVDVDVLEVSVHEVGVGFAEVMKYIGIFRDWWWRRLQDE